jgi:hypothetical protein
VTTSAPTPDLIVTAPNGVAWKRNPGAASSRPDFLAALEAVTAGSVAAAAREWNWWQEGRPQQERDRAMGVLREWNHATPPPGGYIADEDIQSYLAAKAAERESERQARAAGYDKERARARLTMLDAEATAGFMRHIISSPASDAQLAKARELLAASEREAAALRDQVGDPDAVTDEHGDLPPARRERNLVDHVWLFRHRALREWSTGQRPRFRQLLAMPPPRPQDMCADCQAPADWHACALSLCLWRGRPEPGSKAAEIARLMPGWWDRCYASTSYQLRHVWGGADVLPDFGGEQWRAMLTPVLRAIFDPVKPAPRKPRDPRAALERQLQAAEAEAGRLRRQLSELALQDDQA